MCIVCRERGDGVQCMPTAAWPGVEKTGFVYADAQTVYLGYMLHALLYLLSNVNTREK